MGGSGGAIFFSEIRLLFNSKKSQKTLKIFEGKRNGSLRSYAKNKQIVLQMAWA